MALAFFMVRLSHLYMTTGKTTALNRRIFVSKVMSLLYNTLSGFVVALLPRSRCLLISWLQSLSPVILEPKKIKSVTAWKKSYDTSRQHIKKQRHYFSNKGLSHQSYGFSSSHVWMRELDYKESRELKNWCFWIMVLEKTRKRFCTQDSVWTIA